MTRALQLLAMLILTGCAAVRERATPEPAVEAVVVEEPGTIALEPQAPACQPGDDGIGGTGCPVD
jgi:uncharacterized protein YceK